MAQATEKDNVTAALPEWFVNPAAGDLHLTERAALTLRKAPTRDDCPEDFDGQKRGKSGLTDAGADNP